MNDESRIVNRTKHGRAVMMSVAFAFVFGHAALLLSQQPQASAGTPLYAVNAKYVNGMAPGYWATAGSGLALNLSSGTAYCGIPPAPVTYAGGTLTLSASATNYIYLDPAANCAPAANTSGFSVGAIPIARVVTGASSITAVTDERTWSSPNPAAMSSSGAVQISSLGTNQNITLSPSGTGASVITNLVDKGGQVFNVKAYGAVGDGATNDSPAFQAAYNAAVAAGGGAVYIPPSSSCYLLNTAINMTNATFQTVIHPIIIKGSGGGTGGAPETSKVGICGNTGGIVFDVTGSNEITFLNVYVTANATGLSNPSTIGLYAARNSSDSGAQGIRVLDSQFNFPIHSTGSVTTYGVYLYGSEDDYFSRDNFFADAPLTVTASNVSGLHSAFITEATGSQSETQDFFYSIETNSAGVGPAVTFEGSSDMILTGHSWESTTNPPYNYALHFIGVNNSFSTNWRQEGFPGFAQIDGPMVNARFYGTTAPGASTPLHAVEFNGSGIRLQGDTFDIVDGYSGASANTYYDAQANASPGVNIIDHVYFFCGDETNCGDLNPVGQYQNELSWSGAYGNPDPTFKAAGIGEVAKWEDPTAGTIGTITFGRNAPSGACKTSSIYLNTIGSTGTTLYVCENSAWAAK